MKLPKKVLLGTVFAVGLVLSMGANTNAGCKTEQTKKDREVKYYYYYAKWTGLPGGVMIGYTDTGMVPRHRTLGGTSGKFTSKAVSMPVGSVLTMTLRPARPVATVPGQNVELIAEIHRGGTNPDRLKQGYSLRGDDSLILVTNAR